VKLVLPRMCHWHIPELLPADRTGRSRLRSYFPLDVIRNALYALRMIVGFKCADTERLWDGKVVKRFVGIAKQAVRKLDMLDAASAINDLRSPPGNRLEALSGSRKGQHSIRVNDQWRICFVWTAQGPKDVEIVDYH
jgi:toxin HigB-1